VKAIAESRLKWRSVANVIAAVACIAAGVWILMGGTRAFLLADVDLGFHELGHLLFSWSPGLAPALAGSIIQVLVPMGLALYFLSRRESYAAALICAWAATSAANISVYVADAPYQSLTLLGGGRHDWAWILGSLGHVEWAPAVSSGIRWFGVGMAIIGFLIAVVPLIAPRLRAGSEARRQAEQDAREAELRARAPRREPRNLPGEGRRGVDGRPISHTPAPAQRGRQAPAAPAGRF